MPPQPHGNGGPAAPKGLEQTSLRTGQPARGRTPPGSSSGSNKQTGGASGGGSHGRYSAGGQRPSMSFVAHVVPQTLPWHQKPNAPFCRTAGQKTIREPPGASRWSRCSIRAWRVAICHALQHALHVCQVIRRNSLKPRMIPDLGCCIAGCAQTLTHSREVEHQQPGAQQLYRSEARVPDRTRLGVGGGQSWLMPLPGQPLSPNRLEKLSSSRGEGDAQALLGCHDRW
jgi:hypothetical protein